MGQTGGFGFELVKTCAQSGARLGRAHTAHGGFTTPVFMPVGTQAAVKCVSPDELVDAGAEVVLANTYHLSLRPGEDVVRGAGGLHGFMRWGGPILTDSGGFQVFSLKDLRGVYEEGVEFRSHIDGSPRKMTPERSIEIQHALGSDIIMAFDECVRLPAERAYVEQSVERTARWAERCAARHSELNRDAAARHTEQNRDAAGQHTELNRDASAWHSELNRDASARRSDFDDSGFCGQAALFGIVQGGSYDDLRKRSAAQITGIGFPGYAIGGLSVGEGAADMYRTLECVCPELPRGKPRYLMGAGSPDYLIEGVLRGVDMFDCVLPTRMARNGAVMTSAGRLIVRDATYVRDYLPIDEKCGCYACRNFSRAYIRHLLKAGESFGIRLTTIHNLYYLLDLMKKIRQAIIDDSFLDFRREFYAGFACGGPGGDAKDGLPGKRIW